MEQEEDKKTKQKGDTEKSGVKASVSLDSDTSDDEEQKRGTATKHWAPVPGEKEFENVRRMSIAATQREEAQMRTPSPQRGRAPSRSRAPSPERREPHSEAIARAACRAASSNRNSDDRRPEMPLPIRGVPAPDDTPDVRPGYFGPNLHTSSHTESGGTKWWHSKALNSDSGEDDWWDPKEESRVYGTESSEEDSSDTPEPPPTVAPEWNRCPEEHILHLKKVAWKDKEHFLRFFTCGDCQCNFQYGMETHIEDMFCYGCKERTGFNLCKHCAPCIRSKTYPPCESPFHIGNCIDSHHR